MSYSFTPEATRPAPSQLVVSHAARKNESCDGAKVPLMSVQLRCLWETWLPFHTADSFPVVSVPRRPSEERLYGHGYCMPPQARSKNGPVISTHTPGQQGCCLQASDNHPFWNRTNRGGMWPVDPHFLNLNVLPALYQRAFKAWGIFKCN